MSSSTTTSSCDVSGNPSPPSAGAAAGVSGAASAGAAGAAAWPRRQCRDVFWLVVFLLHLLVFGAALALFGLNRFRQADRFNIGRYANLTAEPWGSSPAAGSPEPAPAPPPPSVYRSEDPSVPASELTETYWKFYGAAGGVGAALAWAWLAAAAWRKDGGKVVMRTAVHSLTAYLAVVSVLCFWGKHFFWGVALAVGAFLHFLYVMSVLDRSITIKADVHEAQLSKAFAAVSIAPRIEIYHLQLKNHVLLLQFVFPAIFELFLQCP